MRHADAYEIVLDGELTSDLPDSLGPISRRQERGATIHFAVVKRRHSREF